MHVQYSKPEAKIKVKDEISTKKKRAKKIKTELKEQKEKNWNVEEETNNKN